MDSEIWVEKYRPTHVKTVVMPKSYHRYFEDMVEKGECYNVLLHSSIPGSGKTSLAKAIVNDLQADCKYLNISAQRGIDVLRDEIAQFAMTQSICSTGRKIVICDEFDGATPALQGALRAAIEEYEKNCRFILTCNYVEKIIPALREGRVNVFDFNFSKKEWKEELVPEMKKRMVAILNREKVEFDPEALDVLIDANYPSMRKMISMASKVAKLEGKLSMESISTSESERRKFYTLIESQEFVKAREMVIKNSMDVGELYSQMFREWVPSLDVQKQAAVIVQLANYQYQHNFVVDRELNFAACLAQVMENFG
jgi:DNA polymerase III delta prime subunit